MILTASATLTFGQSSSKDEQVLKDLIKQLTDAQIAYDAPTLDKILTADYIEISPLGEFDPREKVLGFYTPQAKADAGKASTSIEIAETSIRAYKDFAIVIDRFNYTIEVDGKKLPPRSIRAMIVCRKENGKWKIASAQYTGIRPTAPKLN